MSLNAVMVGENRTIYRRFKGERLTQMIIGTRVDDPELGSTNFDDISTFHRNVARSKRESGYFKNLMEFNHTRLDEAKYVENANLVPIIFEESYERVGKMLSKDNTITTMDESIESMMGMKGSPEKASPEGVDMVFLCHGFQGSHLDVVKIKHFFARARPDVYFHCSRANEEETTCDINKMGSNLAREIIHTISMNTSTRSPLKSISFIGHSLGRPS